ncbi:MAG: hypothetical protein IJ633_09135 [Prevotella sp.]|nr:hypothetical protein [Prevotella sp.]
MEYVLMKSRSYRGVISTGFGLYFSHFRLFFKASWLMALLFAAVFAALGMMVSVQLPAITASIMKQLLVQQAPLSFEMAQQYLMTATGIILLTILYLVLDALTYATVLNKLKEHHDTNAMTVPKRWFAITRRLMGRTLKGFLFTILVVLLPGLVLSGMVLILTKYVGVAYITLTVTVVLASLVLILLCLPLLYVFMKYVMNPGTAYFSLLPKAYAIGLRHWGHIFTSCLIGYLLVGVLVIVCTLPAIILSKAHFASQEGFLNGDPLGMPAYITPLTIGTFFMTGFVLVYLCLPMVMIAYYLYGSIESYENEKTKIDI